MPSVALYIASGCALHTLEILAAQVKVKYHKAQLELSQLQGHNSLAVLCVLNIPGVASGPAVL